MEDRVNRCPVIVQGAQCIKESGHTAMPRRHSHVFNSSEMTQPVLTQIDFTVPLVPPSVNHYVKHTRDGRHYVTKEAKAFKEAVWACSPRGRRKFKRTQEYFADLWIFLGKGQRLDADNGPKCVFDGLKEAGLIHSDAKIKDYGVHIRRDWKQPRTEITIKYL